MRGPLAMSRTILLDMRPSIVRPTGVGTVARELCRALVRHAPESRFVLFASSRRDRLPAADYAAANVTIADRRMPNRAMALLWGRLRWPPVEVLAGRCDVAHSFEPVPLPTRRAKTVATVYDLFFMTRPDLTDPDQTEHLRRLMPALLPTADRVITASEQVRRQLLEALPLDPLRVVAIPLGLRPDQRDPATQEERRELRSRLRLPPNFVLCVGTIEPRKNQGGLIRAFARLRDQKRHNGARIILAGRRGHMSETQEKAVADCNITTEVRILDYMTDAEIKTLHALARVVVVPSLDEGFSLPLLEAMAQGTPVAASRRGAIPEVAGDAALLFDPDDIDEMVEVMARALTDEDERARLSSQGPERAAAFTWDAAAQRLLAVYAGLA